MPQVELRIVDGDIRTYSADVVALKYAQFFHGADRLVAEALSEWGMVIDDIRPEVGTARLVESNEGIRAAQVLFVGVLPLEEFDYRQIRNFAADTLAVLGSEAPHTQHLAMTIHGPGYGLDEVEALLAQVSGYRDALAEGRSSASLERISIVEANGDRLTRLRDALSNHASEVGIVRTSEPSTYRLDVDASDPSFVASRWSPGRSEDSGATKPHAFVAMPFDSSMDDVYYYGIQNPVHAVDLLCERVDQLIFTGDILERVKERISTAAVVIADLTGANPNVYLELGYAWGLDVPTVLLVRESDDLRFDVRGQRCLVYSAIRDLEAKLARELIGLGLRRP